jgi:hypothetical protein
LIHTARDAAEWGIKPGSPMTINMSGELVAACETMKKMHKRGIACAAAATTASLDPSRDQRQGSGVLRESAGFHADGALLSCTSWR